MTSNRRKLGFTLIAVALIPTPDDVTIISPLLQLAAGTLLVVFG